MRLIASSTSSHDDGRAMSPQDPDHQPPAPPDPKPHRVPARIDVAGLIGDAREIILVHEGQDYRLRITAKGKLILTK